MVSATGNRLQRGLAQNLRSMVISLSDAMQHHGVSDISHGDWSICICACLTSAVSPIMVCLIYHIVIEVYVYFYFSSTNNTSFISSGMIY